MVLVLLVQLDLSGLDLSELDLSELVCGLFVIAIGLILSKISFISDCGVLDVYLDIQTLGQKLTG